MNIDLSEQSIAILKRWQTTYEEMGYHFDINAVLQQVDIRMGELESYYKVLRQLIDKNAESIKKQHDLIENCKEQVTSMKERVERLEQDVNP